MDNYTYVRLELSACFEGDDAEFDKGLLELHGFRDLTFSKRVYML